MRSWILAACAACLWTAAAGAQAPQYTAPGGGETGGEVKSKEQLEQEMAEARWDLGPIRLAPWLGLRNLSYQGNVFGDEGGDSSDLTGTFGAGLSAYLPTGPDVFWVAQVIPEYVWWLDLDERNDFVGRYGLGVYADLNRLRFSVHATSIEEQAVVTSETEQLALAGRDRVAAAIELALTARSYLFAEGSLTEIADRSGLPDDPRAPDLALLDREERVGRGGVRLQLGPLVELQAGAELTEVDFELGSRNLSHKGTSPFIRWRLDGNRIDADVSAVRRSLDPVGDSDLVPVDLTSGAIRLTVTPGWRFTVEPYGSRSVAYSLGSDYSHFVQERYGLAVGAPFDRIGARAFVEAGGNRYEPLGAAPDRDDDLTGWGVSLTYEAREWLRYQAGFHRLEYDSNLPGLDREVDRIESSVTLTTGTWAWQ